MNRILVIDHDEELRLALCQLLTRAGYRVDEAADGRTGLWCYREHPADVVITEIFMPEQDGLQTICEIRHDYPEARIIAMSDGGRAKLTYLSHARSLGACHILKKPFRAIELICAVEEALEGPGHARHV